MQVIMTEWPTDEIWLEVKRRALVTEGLKIKTSPTMQWKKDILEARHSPIRRINFSFLILDVPYWVAGHLVRHIHAQPYVKSQRNDRQTEYDRNKAPQDEPVMMIWDVNGEELMTIANKRLCQKASKETRQVVQMACLEVLEKCPEYEDMLIPMCEYQGYVCHEMKPCGRYPKWIRK